MKNIILFSLVLLFSSNALAYDRGDIAYACYKNSAFNKFLWIAGKKWEACKVRVLEKSSSGSYRLEMNDYCSASSNKSYGEVFWFDGSLYSSAASCEE